VCHRLLGSFVQLRAELHAALSKVFYADTVDEWLSVSVDSVVNKLARIVSVASQQIQLGARVRFTARTNVDATPSSAQ